MDSSWNLCSYFGPSPHQYNGNYWILLCLLHLLGLNPLSAAVHGNPGGHKHLKTTKVDGTETGDL